MIFGIEFWAITFDFLGKLLIAATAIMAHRRIVIEKRLDKLVFEDLKLEFSFGIIGIIALIIGYSLHLIILN